MTLCKLHKLNIVLVLTVSLAPSPHVATCCFPVCFLQLVLTHPCGVGCCFVRQRHLSMVHVFYGPSLVNVWRSLAHFVILFVQVGLSLVHPGNDGHAFCIVVPLPPSAYILLLCFSGVATHLSNFAFDACCQVSRVNHCDLFVFSWVSNLHLV